MCKQGSVFCVCKEFREMKNPDLIFREINMFTIEKSAWFWILWNSTCRFFDILKHSSVMHLLNANYMFEILNRMLKRVILDLCTFIFSLLLLNLKLERLSSRRSFLFIKKALPTKQKSLHKKTLDANRNRKWMFRLLLNSVKPSFVCKGQVCFCAPLTLSYMTFQRNWNVHLWGHLWATFVWLKISWICNC